MPCRHTRGFVSVLHRADHFQAHGARLGIMTEEEYETFADEFLQHPCPASALEFRRPWNGDLVRYDEAADVFAILGNNRFIKTCVFLMLSYVGDGRRAAHHGSAFGWHHP